MELLDEIYKTVKTIDGNVDQLLVWKAEHIVGHKTIKRDLSEVRGCLFEKNGLMSQVQGLQGCKRDIKSQRQFVLGILSKVIAAGIVAFMTWAIIRLSGA